MLKFCKVELALYKFYKYLNARFAHKKDSQNDGATFALV